MAFKLEQINRGIKKNIIILKLTPKARTLVSELPVAISSNMKNAIIPCFMYKHNINPDVKGFRMVAEIAPDHSLTEIKLITNEGNLGVPAQNPQDWIMSPLQPWHRYQPGDAKSFFDFCADASGEHLEKMKFGIKMLYPFEDTKVFGVLDGDPKAKVHFLMLAKEPYGNMADEAFTSEIWHAFFLGAGKILSERAQGYFARFIGNCGYGYQSGPRVHMHVMASEKPLPSIFPSDHGFIEMEDGSVSAPAGSQVHIDMIELLIKRKTIEGFSPEAIGQRKVLDDSVLAMLAETRIR